MKDLRDYILEAQDKENDPEAQEEKVTVEPTHTITFDFAGLEGSKEMIEELHQMEGITVDGEKVTVVASKTDINAISEFHNKISEYVKKIRNSIKRSSNEGYAQKTKSFAAKLNDLDTYIDNCKNEEE